MRLQRKVTVKGAASLLSNILHNGRWTFMPYMVQLILAGVDSDGAHIYSLDAIGALEDEKKFFSTGSGSPFALGVLEDSYADEITVEEGKNLVIRAVSAAVQRDIASGGRAVDVVTITEGGVQKETHPFISK